MKNILKFSLIAICATFIFTGCKKNENESPATRNEFNIGVSDGMLVFSSRESFSNTIKSLSSKRLSDVDSLLTNYNYKSLNLDTSDVVDDKFVIYDPLFRRLLNDKYSIKIANEIFVVKNGNEYLIQDGNLSTYNAIIRGESTNKLKNVKVNSLLPPKVEIRTNSIPPFQGTRQYLSEQYNNGRPERVYMEIYSQSFAVYASQGVLVRGQAYRKGGLFGSRKWRDDEMYRARISGMAPIPTSAFGQTPFDTGWVFGQIEVNYTIQRWDASDGTVPATPVLRNLDVVFEYQKTINNPTGSLVERVTN